jgi:hypothetical protein
MPARILLLLSCGSLLCLRAQAQWGPAEWHISYTFSSRHVSSGKSAYKTRTEEERMNGSVEMVISGQMPDAKGNLVISTQNDSLESCQTSGSYGYGFRSAEKDMSGQLIDRRSEDYTGTAIASGNGFEFDFDPSEGGVRAVNTGLGFTRTGKDERWHAAYSGGELKKTAAS